MKSSCSSTRPRAARGLARRTRDSSRPRELGELVRKRAAVSGLEAWRRSRGILGRTSNRSTGIPSRDSSDCSPAHAGR